MSDYLDVLIYRCPKCWKQSEYSCILTASPDFQCRHGEKIVKMEFVAIRKYRDGDVFIEERKGEKP